MERDGRFLKSYRVVVVLAVGALALSLRLEGAPVSPDARSKAVVDDEPLIVSQETLRTEATRIKLGRIPRSLPVMPVV